MSLYVVGSRPAAPPEGREAAVKDAAVVGLMLKALRGFAKVWLIMVLIVILVITVRSLLQLPGHVQVLIAAFVTTFASLYILLEEVF